MHKCKNEKWSKFRWKGFKLGEKAFPKAVLLLPLRLDDFEGTFWMQLDTGTPRSILNEHQLKKLTWREKVGTRD